MLLSLTLSPTLPAQLGVGEVEAHQKISSTQGGLTGPLELGDRFGRAVTALGDLDGDGIGDIAVGAVGDDDGGNNAGAVYVLHLAADGTVKAETKITEGSGGFTALLNDGDEFGWSLAGLGDIDGDDVPDLAVGAWTDDDGGLDRGAIWLLFLNADGTVKSHSKISDTAGGFTGGLDDLDHFGDSIALVGDLDDDGNPDLAVGAAGDDDGAVAPLGGVGAVWILFLAADGTVASQAKISATSGGFSGDIDDDDAFGVAVAGLGDLNGDGTEDLAVGAHKGGVFFMGDVWMLFLATDGSVVSHVRITLFEGGFEGILSSFDGFGVSIARLGDLDHDGVDDLVVGARNDDDGGLNRGAAWVLLLEPDGTVKDEQKISDLEGSFDGVLEDHEYLGRSVAAPGDLDGDGTVDVVVTQHHDGDGGEKFGSAWVMFLHAAGWIDLGTALAGTHGEPALTGQGTLLAGDPVTLSLSGALENAAAFVVIGFTPLLVPFKGGVLVPDIGPPGFVLSVVTDGAGGLVLESPWPTGLPAGLEVIYQVWVQDPAGPQGFAASAGVKSVAP